MSHQTESNRSALVAALMQEDLANAMRVEVWTDRHGHDHYHSLFDVTSIYHLLKANGIDLPLPDMRPPSGIGGAYGRYFMTARTRLAIAAKKAGVFKFRNGAETSV